MLRLLLFLTALGLGDSAQRVTEEMDISSCPVTYYEKTYNKMFYIKDTDNNIIYICFDELADLTNAVIGDCLKFAQTLGVPFYEILTDLASFQTNITAIKATDEFKDQDPTCAINIKIQLTSSSNFVMFKFGDKTATAENLYGTKKGLEFLQFAGGKQFSNEVYYESRDEIGHFLGCRHSPGATKLGELTGKVLPGCLSEICTADGPATGDSACKEGAICVEEECVFRHHCAVTGNTIIDHLEKSATVSNFCPLMLIENANIEVESFFAERRFSGVPLVVGLGLKIDGIPYYLMPDGTVKVPGKNQGDPPTYTDPTEAGAAVGKALLKTVPGGVLVSYTVDKGADYEIFFDGTTALITITYTEDKKESIKHTGTCLDVSSPVSDESVTGCKTVEDDSRGDNIDCDAVKSRCDGLLKAAPFDGCAVDKKLYIEACSNLLCDYPDVDGVLCHVLGAYAHVCELEAWREAAACPLPVCIGESCDLRNEFCGVSLGGDPRCFCRHSFKKTYDEGKFGGDAVCADMTASLSLVPCLLEEKDVDKDSLTLNDDTCTGVPDEETGLLVFSFDGKKDCGAEVTLSEDGTHITYSNTIKAPGADGPISRSDDFSIEFSCKYTQPEVQTLSLKIMDSSVVQTMDTGSWTYTMTMKAFTDASLGTELVKDSELTLDQQLWMQLEATNVDGTKLSLVIESCWATKVERSDAEDKYSLIKDGCSDEDSVAVVSNGDALSGVFSFNVFQFVGSDTDVYLHCETKLCITSTGCTKTCT